MVKKNFHTQTFINLLFVCLEMLRANDIVPPQEHALETPPISETSSRKGEYIKVKRDVESGSEIDDEDSLSIREKVLLVCSGLRFYINY
jgi:hypothetical protein